MLFVEFHYAYFVLTLPFIVAWLLLFWQSKHTRKEQLFMSFALIPLGPISELLYFHDYWTPESIFSFHIGSFPVLLEDILFVMAIGGIGSVIYEATFRKHLHKINAPVHYKIGLPFIVLIATAITLGLFFVGLNSIFATSIGSAVMATFMVAQRKDLLVDSLVSGLMTMLVMFLAYFLLFNIVANTDALFAKGWLLYGTPLDIRLFGNIPFTEMVWGFSAGLVLGPLYEFFRKMKFGK